MQLKKACWGEGDHFFIKNHLLINQSCFNWYKFKEYRCIFLRLQRDNKILRIINFMEVYLLIYSENSEGGDTIILNRKFSEGLLKDLKPLSQEKPGKDLFLTRLSMVQIF